MSTGYSLPMLENMRQSQKVTDSKAKMIAQILTNVFKRAIYANFRRQVNDALNQLKPAIQENLKTNVGVMLSLSYDIRKFTNDLDVPEYIALAIAAKGDDRWKVENELRQPSISKSSGNSKNSPAGCSYDDRWCSKERVYLWVTRFYIDFVSF